MRNIAIKQGMFFPLGLMLVIMVVGLTVPGYSSMSQQMSALGLVQGYPAIFESVCALVIGLSIIAFSLALIKHPSGKFSFTVFTSLLFGISMLFNGMFPMGNPLHGLYGIGFFTILTPALFVAEIHSNAQVKSVAVVSKWAAVIVLFYLWLTITGFDPDGFRGLTQRVAVIPMLGWYSYASYVLVCGGNKAAPGSLASD